MAKVVRKTIRIVNQLGLHARPAMLLAEEAGRFSSHIDIERADDPAVRADAKSVMQLLILAATHQTQLILTATGDDAEEAIAAMTALIDARFQED